VAIVGVPTGVDQLKYACQVGIRRYRSGLRRYNPPGPIRFSGECDLCHTAKNGDLRHTTYCEVGLTEMGVTKITL
jgi:hypothetical protein